MLASILHPIIYQDIAGIVAEDILWERFANKRVLISGANGFLASYMIYALLHANDVLNINCSVSGICRNKIKADQRFSALYHRTDFEVIIKDVNDFIDMDRKVDFIIHAASQASPKFYGSDPVGTLNANVIGTNNLLSLARKNNIEGFLYFSSSEVYGSVNEAFVPTGEKDFGYIDLSNVRACYAESKRMGEVMCISWWKQFDIPVKIVRPFHTYGPGMQLNDGRVYADFVADIVAGKDIELNSEGTARRAFCYLMDATVAFLKTLTTGKSGEAYNVGNPDAETSIIGLAETLVKLFPEKNLSVARNFTVPDGYIPSAVQRNIPCIDKILKLGWKPVTDIENGFSRTIKSYQ